MYNIKKRIQNIFYIFESSKLKKSNSNWQFLIICTINNIFQQYSREMRYSYLSVIPNKKTKNTHRLCYNKFEIISLSLSSFFSLFRWDPQTHAVILIQITIIHFVIHNMRLNTVFLSNPEHKLEMLSIIFFVIFLQQLVQK